MTSIEEIEEEIKSLLLTNVLFSVENKKLKSGKLMLFSMRDFFCIFTLISEDTGKRVVYEIPYPFSITRKGNAVVFNYTIDTFCEKSLDIHEAVEKLTFTKTAKYFNKELVITPK